MLFVHSQASWSLLAKTATVSTLGLVHAEEGRADMGTTICERSCSDYVQYFKFLNVILLFILSPRLRRRATI